MKNMKLQSAMEYLMTYGWAILIIAVVMVALFSLGILGGSPLGTTCLPQSGFECTSPVFSHSTGQLSVTMGQNSGTGWTSANIIFVPQGVSTTQISGSIFSAQNDFVAGAVNNGQIITATIPVVNTIAGYPIVLTTMPAVGYTAAGTIWVQYTVAGSSAFYYAEMATATLKAA
jgi:hypothetical protein